MQGKPLSERAPLCYRGAVRLQEDPVPPTPNFREELEAINRELRKSFLKLQSLLEKKRRALREAEILEDHREREHLEEVIRQIERLLREIRDIGLPPPSTDPR